MDSSLGRYRSLWRHYLLPHWRLGLLLTGLLFVALAFELIGPQILRAFIDDAQRGESLGVLLRIAIVFLLVAVATQVVTVAETYVAENLGWLATNGLRADLALHCLRLDPPFLNAHPPGDLIERIDGDVTLLGNFFSRFIVYVVANVLLVAGVLIVLFTIDWRIGAALTLFTVVLVIVTQQLREVAVPQWTAARQSSADFFGFLEERLAGTEDIRSSGATAYTMRRFYELSRDLLRRTRRASVVGSTLGGIMTLHLAIGTAIALAFGVYLYQGGAITIGTVYLIFSYTQMMNRPFEQITRQLQELQQAGAGVARIHALLGERSAIEDGLAPATFPAGSLAAELDHVTFSYEEDEPALQDVTFCVRPGEVLGLLGRTGSGKTTISRLLFRLYDPSWGAVRLGGVDLRDATVAEVRERVGMVTQDIQLFHASVRDNLTFFDTSIPDERIRDVLEDLGLWAWCEELPQGLDTRLTTGSSGLSAGESQLLAFARVFLKDPGLVILDEASSRLDPATQRRVEHAVDRLLEGRTGIIIAHRLETVQRADTVLVLDAGRVAEYGRREQLAVDPSSRFARMLRAGMEEVLV